MILDENQIQTNSVLSVSNNIRRSLFNDYSIHI